ncbi:unnamed protein product [Staurois parvus]|uniref:Uncharacterized protein n=1 Tax=Staurois parvus TaxID=386267 RepID=A0ABN9CBH2_9NEOB|nr:unnamed protein product [Staurois parvus]
MLGCLLPVFIWGLVTMQLSTTGPQGRTDNSCCPQAIRDHRAPVFLPKLKKNL